jgi:beta-glucosidase-like glycosyl hydrolase
MKFLKPFFFSAALLFAFPVFGQRRSFIDALAHPSPQQRAWVDSVFKKLNRKERIAQLFMVRAHTDLGKKYEDSVAMVIRKEHVGGLVFFQGGPQRQADLIRNYQNISDVPLLIAQDAEWGLGMRLDSTVSYPYQMTLGAIRNDSLIYRMGREIARDFQRMGMHVNFAPDVDVNNNPANPVIGYRSFGDNKVNVAAKGAAYMRGMQDEGLLVTLKHFPGHGDTDVDSHLDLPQLPFSRERLDSLELYPFKQIIAGGASGVMVAHMSIPALDDTPHLPSTLSPKIINGLLKHEIGFKGLVFSDAMEMKGVVKYFPGGEADVRALIAGNDVIELSQNSERAVKMIRKAIRKKRLPKDQVAASVKKVLAAKFWLAQSPQPANTTRLTAFLNRPEAIALNQELSDAAVTLLKGDLETARPARGQKIALVSLGVTEPTVFQNELKARFPDATLFILSRLASTVDMQAMMRELETYDCILVGIHDYRKRPGNQLDYNNELKVFISGLSKMNSLTCVFANPYAIAGLPGIEQSRVLLMNYQNSDEMQRASAKALSGELIPSGKLPVTINAFFRTGDGIMP